MTMIRRLSVLLVIVALPACTWITQPEGSRPGKTEPGKTDPDTTNMDPGTPGNLPPPVVVNLGDCAELAKEGGIDATLVGQCPDPTPGEAGDERIILSLNPNKPNFGLVLCTCNLNDPDQQHGVFQQCDPNAVQKRGVPPRPGGPCTNGKGFLERVPFSITGVEDPDSLLCFVVGGDRTCYFHFGDK